MWLLSAGPSATRRSRRPGQRPSRSAMAPSTVAASTSTWRVNPGKRGVSVPGRRTSATAPSVEDGNVHRRDRGEVVRDLAPGVALVGAREHLARARAEVDARDVVRVDRHPLPQNADARILLRKSPARVLPARAAVAGAPDVGLAVVHRAVVAAVHRDDIERLAVVRMSGCSKAEVARQAFRDLAPRLLGFVREVHSDLVLLM